ncbi:hypothetical protein P3T37_004068 [Kitasatospora sp. MAA4]|uniref:hypothetical protein n=1 Tax=Kitasatospora sp. MAA4 TaxID=3035093 RepID=UPI00247396D1|nr:hypothetical protein [Kitasatospora sp. MAA4]MDH6134664.1 hypothetical protein [Kitasatospora sp. MAA4]
MAARLLPTAPAWSANQEITSTLLNQISTYLQFWANPPSFRAEQHTVQSLANATTAQITCETTVHDSDTGLSTSSPFSYVVPFAGIWDFDGGVGFAANATGLRAPMICQNGTQINGGGPIYSQVANSALFLTSAKGVVCNVGDVIGLYAQQQSGAALSTSNSSGQYSWFAGRLVSLQTP